MSASNFLVRTHVFEGQHLRHNAGATRHGHERDAQYLEAKQYTPLDNPHPVDGDITIIAFHGVGFAKELYEPLWDDLLTSSRSNGFRIRSIWFADATNHGASFVLNEQILGDSPSFWDHSRDVLHMTNVFREHMIEPIVGIGHSSGAAALINMSSMHPRLFSSLVLMDPVLGLDTLESGPVIVGLGASKQDLFPTREAAEKIFRKQFKTWDPRAFDRWMKHGLRDTPTLLYPEPGKVTLSTTKANEVWNYVSSQFDSPSAEGTKSRSDWIKYPDLDPTQRPFHHWEGAEADKKIVHLRPDVLYVFPQRPLGSQEACQRNFAKTGTGVGGNGGAKGGRVARVTVPKTGHTVPLEDPTTCARLIAEWLGPDLKAWHERVQYERENRDEKSVDGHGIRLPEDFIEKAKMNAKRGWVRSDKSKL